MGKRLWVICLAMGYLVLTDFTLAICETVAAGALTAREPMEDSLVTWEFHHVAPRRKGQMDVVMWYDIDHGASTNERPEQGWWPLNPNHPGQVQVEGIYRTTTPLLGLYDCNDPKVAYQHAYWLSAMGVNAIAIDWTNLDSPREDGIAPGWFRYCRGVVKNTSVLMGTFSEIRGFDAPKAFVAVRLRGLQFDRLRALLDDAYELYKRYPETWYKLEDGSEDARKPFILVFVDWDVLRQWAISGSVSFDDVRFNLRFTNGYLANLDGVVQRGANGALEIPGQLPYWLFVENVANPTHPGYYTPVYKASLNGQVEEMVAWVALHKGRFLWDGMLDEVDGKSTFDRSISPAYSLRPQVLLIGRWNYPVAWLSQPQEGLSLDYSTMIEPSVDLGFSVMNKVTGHLYDLQGWKKEPPGIPEIISLTDDGSVEVVWRGFPLEYRISKTKEGDGAWMPVDITGE